MARKLSFESIFAELRANTESADARLAMLRDEIDRIKRKDRDLIPVLCSLFVERLRKLAARGEGSGVVEEEEERNIRNWLHAYSAEERFEQERRQEGESS